jgi:hypothetical protein
MNVIGCDCGGDGALYQLVLSPDSGWTPGEYLRMPMVDVGKRIREVNIGSVVDWLKTLPTPTLFAIEAVGYMPSGDGKSGFVGGGFGSSILSARYNRLVGMLETLRAFPYEKVTPQTWKSRLGVKVAAVKGETGQQKKQRVKAATSAFIRQRYPTAVLIPPRSKKENDGLLDALAIAHYATVVLTANTVVTAASMRTKQP